MKKILVVEDEYYARKSIVKILQESDLDIQVCGEAANGMKAIELLEEYKDIALVITDIQMQKMGGLELASYLHKHIPEIDVLILTAFENFDYAREALRYNVKDYIVKPIYKENLLPPVKKVLEKQEEKSRNQEKIKNYYQWEAAKNYFPVKTIVAHEELYKEFFSYNAIHQEEKFCIVVMQEEELVTDVELVNRIIQEKYRGFIKDFFFSKINEEYVMLLSGIECMDNELIVQEKVESMLSYFCTCKHMNITMGVGLVYSSKEKIYQSYNEALYALNQRLIQGWNRAYFYKNMDGYKARIGKEAEIKLESIVRTRKEKEINQVIHSILEDIIIKEESAQKLYMAVVEILKILGNYYAELYQDEDIEELKDIKVMFSRRYDLYKFKHIEELENYLKEMVIVICSGKENTKKKSKIVEEIVGVSQSLCKPPN
ncbi:MAG: response regulator [Lachnospiraceae bacterium]